MSLVLQEVGTAPTNTHPTGRSDMSFIDKLKGKATQAVDQHGDKIAKGIDRAADAADRRTGGKHADKIAKGRTQAKSALDKLDKKNGGDLGGPRG